MLNQNLIDEDENFLNAKKFIKKIPIDEFDIWISNPLVTIIIRLYDGSKVIIKNNFSAEQIEELKELHNDYLAYLDKIEMDAKEQVDDDYE